MKHQQKSGVPRSKREKWVYFLVVFLVVLIPPSFNSVFGVYGNSQFLAYAIACAVALGGMCVWERWGRDRFPLPSGIETEVSA